MHIIDGRARASYAKLLKASMIQILVVLCLAVEAIPQQQLPAQEQLQPKANNFQQKQQQQQEPNIGLSAPNKTADLSLLINETLAINNKTQSSSDKTVLKDDWTFDMIEYDLMEFLQDLSARYKKNNKTGNYDLDSTLDAKQEAPLLRLPIETVATKVVLPVDELKHSVESKKEEVEKVPVASSAPKIHPTSYPQLSTSLASGDQEIAESSWQYGIFDRFTRPKSTTRGPTTPSTDALYESESGARLDVRNFNNDECGLRTYEEQSHFYPDQLDLIPDEISKRQRMPITSGNRIKLPGSILIPIKDRLDAILEDKAISSEGGAAAGSSQKQPAMMDQWEGGPIDEGSGASDNQTLPFSGEGMTESEFNLASRRHWLQQQLGNTLQILGFSPTNQSVGDLFVNQSDGYNSNSRENMMKMSGKWGKTADLDKGYGQQLPEQKLIARQDDLKLEARVIGGSDARLGDSPWSVSLQALVSRPGTGAVEYRHYCGGTIISEYYVLTAAHCLDFMVGRESRLFVVVGDINWRMSTSSLHGRRFGIEKLIIHSGYKSTAFGHDIGLIKTRESMKPLKVNGKYIINSVCLPQKGVEHSGEAELVGWGLFSNRNEMADSLQIADVPILPRPLCVDLYRRRTGLIQWLIGIELITDKQVCAGTFGRGICQGDSGSALVVNEKFYRHSTPNQQKQQQQTRGVRSRDSRQSKATIIGIVAFGGIRRCSYQSLPGVYMQTSKYMDWILPRIQN